MFLTAQINFILIFEDRNPAGVSFPPRQEKALPGRMGSQELGQKTWLDGFRHPWSSTYFDLSQFLKKKKKSLLNCALLDSDPFLRAPFQERYVLKSSFGYRVFLRTNSLLQSTMQRMDTLMVHMRSTETQACGIAVMKWKKKWEEHICWSL